MSLYRHIAGIYDELFPLNKACMEALEALVPVTEARGEKTASAAAGGQSRPRRVLDLGCATGTLVAALEDRGLEALGVELDPDMAAKARGRVLRGSMLEAETLVRKAFADTTRGTSPDIRFDAVLCLGNTLPHIRQAEYDSFFASVSRLLGRGGVFIIQTLNYSHPSVKPGYVFQPISAGGSVFNRSYEAGAEPDTLTFVTDIDVEGRHYRDKTTLYPVKPEDLDIALGQAGFGSVKHYAGWNLSAFDPALDLYLITVAAVQENPR